MYCFYLEVGLGFELMVRVKINLPQEFPYQTEIRVQIGDINYGNHLSNDAVLRMCHEARVRYLKSFGFTERDALGKGIILSDSMIVYKGEGFHGDLLKVQIALQDFNKYGFDMMYLFTRDGKDIAHAKTGIVFFDYELRKVSQLPEGFRKAVHCE